MYLAVYYFAERWEKKIDIPAYCDPQKDDDCILNVPVEIKTHMPTFNKDRLDQMISELQKRGFNEEAEEVREKVKAP
jgi:macrodomain Ter protein organizer (MatP/YcbG family)